MSWNIHHTTHLSLCLTSIGALVGAHENSVKLQDYLHQRENLNEVAKAFNANFIVLNLASVFYDYSPKQKTVVKITQVPMKDEEGKEYLSQVKTSKEYNVTSTSFDTHIKLFAVGLGATVAYCMKGAPEAELFISAASLIPNALQVTADMIGFSDAFDSTYLSEVNGLESIII